MSKTFGMAGARIGRLVTKDAGLYQKMAAFVRLYGPILRQCSVRFCRLLLCAIQRGHHWQAFDPHKKKPGFAGRLLCEFGDRFAWVRPQAGTIAFPKLKGPVPASDSPAGCSEAEIMLLPSTVFDLAIAISGWASAGKDAQSNEIFTGHLKKFSK